MKRIFNIVLLLILLILSIFVLTVLYNLYRTEVSKSARMSKDFERKLEAALLNNENEISIRSLTDFEWNIICPFSDFEKLDFKKKNISDVIGSITISKNKYSTVHSDLNGIVFLDTKSQKIYVLDSIKKTYSANQKNYEMYINKASCFNENDKKSLIIAKDNKSPNLFFINFN